MLHFQGFASEWHPLCKKYSVWSGKPIPQKTHCNPERDRFTPARHKEESEGCSGPVEVIVPFVAAESTAVLSGLLFGDEVPLRLALLLVTIFLFKSSRNKLFSGETLMRELKLLDVADCNCTLPEGDVLRFTGPLRLSNSSAGSCFIGISDMDGVMLVSWSILKAFGWMWLLDGAFEFESADWGEPGHSPFIRCDESPDWPGWELDLCWSH